MASGDTTFIQRLRKAIRVVGIGIAPSVSTADSAVPKITAGSGAPTAADPNGSVYMRTDGTAGTSLYRRVSGAWVAGSDIEGLRTSSSSAAAITAARVLTLADSGGVFSVSQAAAYDIDLPSPTTGAGCRYFFHLTGAAANAVTITVAGAAATFVGTIAIDGATIVATGSTLTFASGAAALGDSIEIQSLTTGLYHVRAFSSAAGGITVA
jgi:hypothetical protein